MNQAELERRARAIEWLVLDVDGVLTDGTLYYGARGEELKTFSVRDGLALVAARRVGLRSALLSSRSSPMVERRASELGIEELVLGCADKAAGLAELLERTGASASRVAAIGDDLVDLPVLRRASLAYAPADAVPEVRALASVVLDRGGGRGAVRAMIEHLLRLRGEWAGVVEAYATGS